MNPKARKKLDASYRSFFWDYSPKEDAEVSESIIVHKGKGAFFEDINHKKYIDGISSLGCSIHGHNNKILNQAIIKQLIKIAFTVSEFDSNLINEQEVILADKLIKIAPAGLRRVIFSGSGSEAVEMALKVSLLYWKKIEGYQSKRNKFVYFQESYHGDTFGCLGICGNKAFLKELYKSTVADNFCVPSPYCYRCKFGLVRESCRMRCLQELEKILTAHANEIAGIVIEPLVQAFGGIIIQPEGYQRKLRNLADKFKVLLIFDEVATGFGKTGKMFAAEHEGVTADIMCIGKALSGGYLPISATLIREEIYKAFYAKGINVPFPHGHTYSGNQLSCAVAIANLDLFEKEGILKKLTAKINLLERLLKRFSQLDTVGEVRHKGLSVGIEMKKEINSFFPNIDFAQKIRDICLRNGLYIWDGNYNTVIFSPPLTVTEDELKKAVEILFKSFLIIDKSLKSKIRSLKV